MLPDWFPELVEYFIVPVGVIFIAYVHNNQFRLKFSSGSDFFVFFVSLDLNALVVYNAYKGRINPLFAEDYLAVFVCLTVLCMLLLGLTLKAQERIDLWRSGRIREYPLARVFLCWCSSIVLIPAHLYVFFGRK